MDGVFLSSRGYDSRNSHPVHGYILFPKGKERDATPPTQEASAPQVCINTTINRFFSFLSFWPPQTKQTLIITMARARLTDPSYSVIFEREREGWKEGKKKITTARLAPLEAICSRLLSDVLEVLNIIRYRDRRGIKKKSDGVLPFVQATNNKFGRRVKVAAAAADEKVSSPNNGRLDFFFAPARSPR